MKKLYEVLLAKIAVNYISLGFTIKQLRKSNDSLKDALLCLIDCQSTIYQVCRDEPSWVEPVLSKD